MLPPYSSALELSPKFGYLVSREKGLGFEHDLIYPKLKTDGLIPQLTVRDSACNQWSTHVEKLAVGKQQTTESG